MIMNKTYIYFDLLSPIKFLKGKKIKLIKEGSIDMHIEEKETNLE